MKIIKKITFRQLRDEGVNSLNIKDDEVVQIRSKDGFKYLVDHDYLQKLILLAEPKKNDFTEFCKDFSQPTIDQKGVIYTNTAIGFEKLNKDILKNQKEELLAIFSGDNSKETVEANSELFKSLSGCAINVKKEDSLSMCKSRDEYEKIEKEMLEKIEILRKEFLSKLEIAKKQHGG